MEELVKQCPWCLEEFTTKYADQKYCNKSHKTYMSQYNNGKRKPPLIWNTKKIEIPKEGIPKAIKKLEKELADLLKSFEKKKVAYLKTHISKVRYKPDMFAKQFFIDLINTRLAIFNINEQIFDLENEQNRLTKNVFTVNEIANIKRSSKDKILYQFDKTFFGGKEQDEYLDSYYRQPLMGLGTLPKPFFASLITDMEGVVDEMFFQYSLFQYSLWVANGLLIFRQSKIVFVISKDFKKEFIDAVLAKEIKDSNFLIMLEDSSESMLNRLLKHQPEFVFFKLSQKLDLRFFNNLKEILPKTSVFHITDYKVSEKLEKHSNLIIINSFDEEEKFFKKGGVEDLFPDWWNENT